MCQNSRTTTFSVTKTKFTKINTQPSVRIGLNKHISKTNKISEYSVRAVAGVQSQHKLMYLDSE